MLNEEDLEYLKQLEEANTDQMNLKVHEVHWIVTKLKLLNEENKQIHDTLTELKSHVRNPITIKLPNGEASIVAIWDNYTYKCSWCTARSSTTAMAEIHAHAHLFKDTK